MSDIETQVKSAKKYLELELRISQVKKKLKELEDEKKAIVEFFKSHRTGEIDETLKIRSSSGNFNITFKDTTRRSLDQAKAKALLQANNIEVPYSTSIISSAKVYAAIE